MGVSSTVKDLAEAIGRFKAVQDPRHRLQAEILTKMPFYTQLRDLGAWEAAFQDSLPDTDDSSEIGMLLMAVFEFGQFNLYGRFQPAETVKQYSLLRTLLAQHGISVEPNPSLGDW